MIPEFFQTELIRNNVIPKVERLPGAIKQGFLKFNADNVNIYRAVANFNSVIQISEKLCGRVIHHQLPELDSIAISLDDAMLKPLVTNGMVFSRDYLNGINVPVGSLGMILTCNPEKLTFIGAGKLRLKYRVTGDFVNKIVKIIAVSGGTITKTTQNIPLNAIDAFSFTLEAPYKTQVDSTSKKVDVLIKGSECSFSFNLPDNTDIKKLFDANFLDPNGSLITESITRKDSIKVIPTLCPVGKKRNSQPITEFSNFDASISIVKYNSLQALVVALNVQAGKHGVLAEVKHFIGDHDYGVISDEFLIDKLYAYVWRTGGFKRSIPIKQPIQVKVNGKAEEAHLVGRVDLTSLNSFLIEVNSDTRRDEFYLTGRGTTVTEKIVLSTGEEATPNNTPGLEFGGDKPTNWAVSMIPAVDYTPESDPGVRAFIENAYLDAQQYASRPFSGERTPYEIGYVRINGITKQMYCLADIEHIFS